MGRIKAVELTEGLTTKQKRFADALLEGKGRTEAALEAYDIKAVDTERVASVIAADNLGKPAILKYLENHGLGAATRIVELSKDAKNETVRLNANKDVLDRVGIGVRNNNVIVPVQINFGKSDEYE